jgi:hypothetical protein
VHADCTPTAHEPDAAQQEPTTGQGFGEHTPPEINVCPVAHGDTPTAHAPVVVLQHAPPIPTVMLTPVVVIGPATVALFRPQALLEYSNRKKLCIATSAS